MYISFKFRLSKSDENISYYIIKNLTKYFIYFLAQKRGLEEISPDVVTLISHASQTRLKTLIEKLSVIAEHRTENPKVNSLVLSLYYQSIITF